MKAAGSRIIVVRNVNQALSDALWWLQAVGVREPSRNGAVVVAPGPVLTEYKQPTERVLFSPVRDANPFFHFMESLWMLAGRNDIGWIAQFNKRMLEYSDDGEVQHGAYGFRWREWFAFDQLRVLVEHLREQPNSRRGVLSMWSPNGDLVASEGAGGLGMKDVPCNTHAYVDLRGGVLNLTVCCRSNDAIWGAYGANAVHFSVLQEYLAMQLRVPVGVLRQFSHNLHVYTDVFGADKLDRLRQEVVDYYGVSAEPFPLLQANEDTLSWECDLQRFMQQHSGSYYCAFFVAVAVPLYLAWSKYKAGNATGALVALEDCEASDWRIAAQQWIERRQSAQRAKAAA